MQVVVEHAWQGFTQQKAAIAIEERDRLLATVTTAVGNRLSFDLGQGVTLDLARAEGVAEHLYSTSGHCVWFAPPGFSYALRVYRRDGSQLVDPECVVIAQHAPLLVRGDDHVVCLNPWGAPAHLAFSLSVPVAGSDIVVYERERLTSIAWFPADSQVSRFIVLLQALQTIGDPALVQVADQLVYHPHPALRWQAFQILIKHMPQKRDEYCLLLRAAGDDWLEERLSGYAVEGLA
ncbi:hypothetical protein [Pseudomonas sp. AFG_SD02_1510_Pfu_092]|uniref:hypothetical protein n=1 Tax=Pseudomonas sp. AFG_SD02_1510_Pfu_092 TaxID=2259497 RepID=UPI0010587A25|nr:hypothetical protein [Pseudomonas sp. AFG_SD02_1510_Pfu_092]